MLPTKCTVCQSLKSAKYSWFSLYWGDIFMLPTKCTVCQSVESVKYSWFCMYMGRGDRGGGWRHLYVAYTVHRPRKNPGASGIRTWDLPLSRRTP